MDMEARGPVCVCVCVCVLMLAHSVRYVQMVKISNIKVTHLQADPLQRAQMAARVDVTTIKARVCVCVYVCVCVCVCARACVHAGVRAGVHRAAIIGSPP